PQEEEIPEPLVYETEMAIARSEVAAPPGPPPTAPLLPVPPENVELLPAPEPEQSSGHKSLPDVAVARTKASSIPASDVPPAALPDVPIAPCLPTNEPVLRHTRTYNGHDFKFTQLLK